MTVFCVFLFNEEEQTWNLGDIFFSEEAATKYAKEEEGNFAIEYEITKWKVRVR